MRMRWTIARLAWLLVALILLVMALNIAFGTY